MDYKQNRYLILPILPNDLKSPFLFTKKSAPKFSVRILL